jgi:hypothetical protein
LKTVGAVADAATDETENERQSIEPPGCSGRSTSNAIPVVSRWLPSAPRNASCSLVASTQRAHWPWA